MKTIALLASLLLCIPVFAQDSNSSEEGGTLPPENILAQVFLVKGQDGLANIKSTDANTKVESLKEAKRGDELYVVVMFKNAQKDPQGIARVSYSLTLTLPNGQTIPLKDLKAGSGPMPDELQQDWIMATDHPKIVLSPDSYPAGEYKFAVVVTDEISGYKYNSEISANIL